MAITRKRRFYKKKTKKLKNVRFKINKKDFDGKKFRKTPFPKKNIY